MGLLAESASVLEDSGPSHGTPSERIAPGVQRARDLDRVRILQDERAKELSNPDADARAKNLAALDTELRAMGSSVAKPRLLTSAITALDDGGKFDPATAPKPEATLKDRATDTVTGLARTALDVGTGPARTAAEVVGSAATSAGQAIVGGWRGLSAIFSGAGLEEAARQVHAPELAGGQTAAAYEPAAGSAAETVNKVVNVPGEVIAGAGRIAGRTTMDVTGSPAAATAVETGINAVPLLLLKSGKTTAASKAVARENATALSKDTTNYDVPTYQRRAAAPKTGEVLPSEGAEAAPKFTEPPAIATEGKSFTTAEQSERAAVLQRVGVEARRSAITGNLKEAATDYQQSKLDGPAGDFIKGKLDAERQALQNFGEQITRDTGGTPGVDAHALEARGHVILSPLEAFRQWFTDKTTGLYNEAKARAQGQPFATDKFSEVLGTDSKFANTDTIELRKGIKARMQELKMIDKDGNALPATVEQAEQLRQYIGEEWSPKSNGRIRELKNALDEDVGAMAGEDIYKQARALHAMKESIFSDPKGLSSILDSEGINRKVPIEKIGDTIAGLPNAQFQHIVRTLKTTPPELKVSADAALAEIKAHMASRLIEAAKGRQAQWGAKDVTTYLNKNAVKFESIFSPEEMAKIRDLNDAGHILRMDTSYPGAAVQKQNLLKRGALALTHSAAASVGALIGTPLGAPRAGAAAAYEAARAFTGKVDEAAALREAKKRWVPLSEVGAPK
jgi:hypothetical protein